MLTPIDPISIRESNGIKRVLTSVEGASRFLTQAWPGDKQRPTYFAALRACLAALEGTGTADQARAAIVEAASDADVLMEG
jgi:hypothetical protein